MKFFIKRRSCLTLLVCMLLLACGTREYLSESELSQFILASDELSKTKEVNGTQIKVTLRPVDLLVAHELGKKENPSKEDVQRLRDKFQSQYYFILSLSRSGKEILNQNESNSSFSELLETLSFHMSDKVTLTTPSQDTVRVADYLFNRTFGMSSTTDLLFAFDKSKIKSSQWIQFNIAEFGLGMGTQSIQFNISDLENTPKIYNLN